MESSNDIQRQKLRESRRKLEELKQIIEDRTKELKSLKEQKKQTESTIAAIEDSLKIYSFDEQQSYPWAQELKKHLKEVFNIRSFRGLQETVINATLSQKDCIYVAATGSGKSLVFQLPALISKGITLVVSPLLSLMEDQVNQLSELGIPSVVINSTTSKSDFIMAMRSMVDHNAELKLIYVTPEKLAKSKTLMAQVEKMYDAGRFSRLVIDEVHCCSEWGHDFRKDYKQLHIFKRQFPETPILGLTATATPEVIRDIKNMLGIPKGLVFTGSFYRPNLVYEIKATSQKDNINDIVDLITSKFQGQSGIIYCLTIKDVEDVASKLTALGVECLPYHASLELKTRSSIQQSWYTNQCKVIAATVAFGLGINKMDVRFVIHYSISKSLENYYQETGRAGRDGKPAFCVCYYRFSDIFRATSLTFRERNGKERVYRVLSFCLNRLVCRKKLIAEYFMDNLAKDPSDTDCCDNCRYRRIHDSAGPGDEFVDASEWLNNLIEVLNQARSQKERVTPNKLIEGWMQIKGHKKMKLDGIKKPSLTRTDCESVVGQLLCEGYFKEEFHMTPYSTISYLVPGHNSFLRSGQSGPLIHKSALESYSIAVKTKVQNEAPQTKFSSTRHMPDVITIE